MIIKDTKMNSSDGLKKTNPLGVNATWEMNGFGVRAPLVMNPPYFVAKQGGGFRKPSIYSVINPEYEVVASSDRLEVLAEDFVLGLQPADIRQALLETDLVSEGDINMIDWNSLGADRRVRTVYISQLPPTDFVNGFAIMNLNQSYKPLSRRERNRFNKAVSSSIGRLQTAEDYDV